MKKYQLAREARKTLAKDLRLYLSEDLSDTDILCGKGNQVNKFEFEYVIQMNNKLQ